MDALTIACLVIGGVLVSYVIVGKLCYDRGWLNGYLAATESLFKKDKQ